MDSNQDITYADQKIIGINMEKEVKQSFLEYSMSVIISRALPDVRDGMKPGQRRIMYAMYEDNLTHDKPFRKSATTVGNVLGRYHPHGDSSVYGTMVRMAQKFSLRYPLVEGHGNFGSVDGDPPAAYRYTEARMSRMADELMRDLEKDVVDMVPNFDNSRKEPSVLPCRFPNLLVNGSIGIAVGMATYIPPHNLGEVIDGTIYLMENPEATVAELMKLIKGPDFPTNATIYGSSGIYQAYSTGRGRVMVRARAEIDEDKNRIIITEIPYQVNKSELVKAMADQVNSKRIEGVRDIRDESGRGGMRIVVECKKDAPAQIILNQFYKYTPLQDTCAMNMLALVNGEPKILTLRQILENYISFQEEIITRRTSFELNKALREAHIFEGYKIAVDNIEEVINIIRHSEDVNTSKENLKNRFDLSDEQAQAIVQMTLGRLSGMERLKIENHLRELYEKIEELRAILADESKIKAIVKDELLEIKRRYADDRKTEIVEAHDDILLEDLIERHQCVITMSHTGYIKRRPADSYTAQRRGGKGIVGMSMKEEDFTEHVIVADSHAYLMLFTSKGRVYVKKAYEIPEASRTARGTNIVNLLDISGDEKITTIIQVDDFEGEQFLLMVTRGGIIKRTPLSEYAYQRKGGKIAISLDEGDELIFVARTDGEGDVMIATKDGNAARFNESRVTVVGRTARGVRGIKLREGDEAVGAVMIESSDEWNETHRLVTITEGGYGKRMRADEFDAKGRAIQGVICHNISDKTGPLCGIAAVTEDEDLMLITNTGTLIRTPVDGIPTYSRTAAGVIVMRLSDGAQIVNFAAAPGASSEEEGED